MLSVVSSLLASLSLALKQPLAGYCDVETTHGDALVTKQGDYCTFVRIGGMKRMATRDDITRLANGLRLDLSGALEAIRALEARSFEAEMRLGASSPRVLGAALMRMKPKAYEDRARLLGGLRLWPRGRFFVDGEDIYPQLIADRVAA